MSADKYLDPMQSLGYLCRINFRVFSRILEGYTLPHGVSAGQWRFLRVLWEQDGISQRELSDRVGTREPTTVRAVRSMIKAGLIQRRRCGRDKRKYFIDLTPRGRELQAELMHMVVTVNERALQGISDEEIATTRRVLSRTYHNLRESMQNNSVDDNHD